MRWVVVGGGTAGCVAAATLAEDEANEVVVVEAGEHAGGRSPVESSLADLHHAEQRAGYFVASGLGGASRLNGGLISGDAGLVSAMPVPTGKWGPVDRALAAAASDARPVAMLRHQGQLVSTAELFLDRARSTGRLTVEHSTVDSVVVTTGRVRGVRLDSGDLVAADAVVVCAGTFGSWAVLWRSGLGAPGVGVFTDHASIVVDLTLRSDQAAGANSLVTGVTLRRAGIEIVPLNHLGRDDAAGALIVGWLESPETGCMRFDDRGVPFPEFEPHDASTVRGLDAARTLAAELLDSGPLRSVVSDALFTDRRGYFHAVGSCRAVVDERGRVHGVEGLVIADASVLPHRPWGPMAATIARARRVGT